MTTIPPIYTHIAAMLRLAREDAGLTQTAAAAQIGVTRSSVSAMEAGKQRVLIETLAAFAELYGCEMQDFLPGGAE
jgi:transcriptional regulator with XRE-family HTH domain